MSEEALRREQEPLAHKQVLRHVVPPFELPDRDGRSSGMWDYKGRRNLVRHTVRRMWRAGVAGTVIPARPRAEPILAAAPKGKPVAMEEA